MDIRLDRNEMPKSPPERIVHAVKQSINEINRYTPQNYVNKLVNLLSDYTNVPQESIILSSGSDILIKEFLYLFSKDRQIIIPDPTFFLITNTAQKIGSPLLRVRLREPDFNFNINPLLEELKKPTLIFIDNPNNPTGKLILEEKNIKTLLENENAILLIDEAYFEFSKITYANLVKNYSNIAVSRTLSKSFGLAGSGIGYLIGGEEIIRKFSGLNTMLPYPSVIAGIYALNNNEYMKKFIEENDKEKCRVMKIISDMGIKVYPSHTNFLLMKTEISEISRRLAEKGVFISDLTHYSLSSEFIRVTIGSKVENDTFVEIIKKIIESH